MNETTDSTDLDEESTALTATGIILTVFALLLSVFIIVVNSITIIVIRRTRSLHTLSNIYVMSLATADLVVGLGLIPLSAFYIPSVRIQYYDKNVNFCVFVLGINLGMAVVSSIHMSLIATDRYLYILRPYTYQNIIDKRLIFIILSITWTFGIFYALLPQAIHNKDFERTKCDVTTLLPIGYMFYTNVTLFVTCVIIDVTMYTLILYAAFKQRRLIHTTTVGLDLNRPYELTTANNNGLNRSRVSFDDQRPTQIRTIPNQEPPLHPSSNTHDTSDHCQAIQSVSGQIEKTEYEHHPPDTKCNGERPPGAQRKRMYTKRFNRKQSNGHCKILSSRAVNISKTCLPNGHQQPSRCAEDTGHQHSTIQGNLTNVDHGQESRNGFTDKNQHNISNSPGHNRVFPQTAPNNTGHFMNAQHAPDPRNSVSARPKGTLRTKHLKFFMTVFGVYFICLTPTVVSMGVDYFITITRVAYNMFNLLALLNSGMNFIIFIILNARFRQAVFKMFHLKGARNIADPTDTTMIDY